MLCSSSSNTKLSKLGMDLSLKINEILLLVKIIKEYNIINY